MSFTSKALLFGFLTGMVGVLFSILPLGMSVEENAGLGLLFKARGAIEAPPHAVIISIDRESAENLGLPDDPARWPRSLHARLVEKLLSAGAKIIAFDIYFIDHRCPEEDKLFAQIIDAAGNIVLCEFVKIEEIANTHDKHKNHKLVRTLNPIEPLLHASQATASLILPRIPFKVSQYWTFQPLTGDSPSLPVVVFSLYTFRLSEIIIDILHGIYPQETNRLSYHRDGTASKELITGIREIFKNDPSLDKRVLMELNNLSRYKDNEYEFRKMISLIKMYAGLNKQYINFYGPPRTITTIPYYQILKIGETESNINAIDLYNKAVFVGLSEVKLSESKDNFHTVFSSRDGLFLSGVEIAATAFLNLLEDMPVKPLKPGQLIIFVFLWGVLLGVTCRMVNILKSVFILFGLGLLYFLFAHYQFTTNHAWYPLIVPIFFQIPLAFFGAFIWNFLDVNKERHNIRKAFEHHLPKEVVDKLAKDISHIKTGSQVVYGICLITDAQEYTSLSEIMEPYDLGKFMNKYYEKLFEPVKHHGGYISGVIGDSMLALWVSALNDVSFKKKACLAAMDIMSELQKVEQKSEFHNLETRIGLHCGKILLGHIGAMDFYEYTPIGDIVNTASRLESLNKKLKTHVLASEDVMHELDDFLKREMGCFKLVGKKKTIRAFEVVSRLAEASEKQKLACKIFGEALDFFRMRSWDASMRTFCDVLDILGEDGPSNFYINLCAQYKQNPPGDSWDGTVVIDKK